MALCLLFVCWSFSSLFEYLNICFLSASLYIIYSIYVGLLFPVFSPFISLVLFFFSVPFSPSSVFHILPFLSNLLFQHIFISSPIPLLLLPFSRVVINPFSVISHSLFLSPFPITSIPSIIPIAITTAVSLLPPSLPPRCYACVFLQLSLRFFYLFDYLLIFSSSFLLILVSALPLFKCHSVSI